MTDAQTPPAAELEPRGEGLSIDQAVSLMTPEAADMVEDDDSPPADEAAAPDEGPADAEDIAPPPFWRAEDKAWFAEQPAEVRERLLAYEKHRDTATAKALRDAAEARKAARAEAEALAGQGAAIGRLSAEAERAFAAAGWDSVDWIRWAETDPQAALRGKLQYEAERDQLQRLSAARQTAETEAFKAYVAEQAQALHALAPELANDEGRRRDVGHYLLGQGYAPEILRGVSALDLSLAHKAMLWDRANDQLKQGQGSRSRTAAPPSRAVRPGAAATTPSAKRQSEEASHRFAQTRSKEDAIRLLNLRGQ